MVTILGPTATGKTRLAVALARQVDGEIISADSRQVYRGMDIGTGKDLEEYREGGTRVPYHLIDIVDPGYEFNVFEFQREFRAACAGIRDRGKVPVLCGGSGMYLEAVLAGYELAEVPVDAELRKELEGRTDGQLIERLAALRPLHNTTDIRDRNRLIRAIEITEHDSGECVTEPGPVAGDVFGLRTDRGRLRERIAKRLKSRLREGLIEEVEALLAGGLSVEGLDYYGLEYRFVTRYLTGELNRNDMTQKLAAAIFAFAKRQEKWFRRMERRGVPITWLDAENNVAQLLEEILERLRS